MHTSCKAPASQWPIASQSPPWTSAERASPSGALVPIALIVCYAVFVLLYPATLVTVFITFVPPSSHRLLCCGSRRRRRARFAHRGDHRENSPALHAAIAVDHAPAAGLSSWRKPLVMILSYGARNDDNILPSSLSSAPIGSGRALSHHGSTADPIRICGGAATLWWLATDLGPRYLAAHSACADVVLSVGQ
ncbi:hypothetical protein BJ912DRAFT_1079840 [Pholiota molesta]|nr:hypothetical protein BJ912DRAFT_1079840 [Pholiota molesta]